ncbi:MAG: PAS domain S-box protein [Nitrospira sp.]|nr:PAS domain S-box protein [Nitrospira sp.]
MPPKAIKQKSSPKRRPALTARSTGTTPWRSSVGSVGEELFAKAFRSSPHPIGITELDSGRCLEVNDACLEIFGFQRDEVVGQTTLMLGIWPDPQERVQFIDRLKAEGKVRNLEVSMRMKDGERRQFIISTDLITLGGKPCLLTIGNDITERKRAEEALSRAHEELEERVAERTAELGRLNEWLQAEITERKHCLAQARAGIPSPGGQCPSLFLLCRYGIALSLCEQAV